MKNINQERKDLILENRQKKRVIDVMAHRLATLIPRPGPMPEAATARVQQGSADNQDVGAEPSDSVAKAQSLLRDIRSNRSQERPPCEEETKETPPRIARATSPAPAVVSSSATTDDEEASPAASAAALIGMERQTTATAMVSVTPSTSTPVLPAATPSAKYVAASVGDAPERASRAKGPTTRGSVGGNPPASSRSSSNIRR